MLVRQKQFLGLNFKGFEKHTKRVFSRLHKRTVAIPLLDNLISQLGQRFNVEERHAGGLLSLILILGKEIW